MFEDFLYLLRKNGLKVSLTEWMSLMEALDKGLHGSSFTGFYHLCRCLLVKSEADFDRFDRTFLEYFRDVPFQQEVSQELLDWLDRPDVLNDYANWDEEQALKNMGLSEEEIRARVERAAQFVGITDAELQKSPFDLSGGQKRRAAIAGVIAMEPDVLILDEPTAGLDPRGRESILQNIRDYQAAQHAAVVMVSHSMEEIASNVDRLLVMNHGQNVMNGTPAEVFSHAEELVEMGLAIPKMTQLFLALKRRGVPVDTSVFSVEQARQALRPLLKGGRGVC